MKILFIGIVTEEVLSKVATEDLISTFVSVEEAAREVEKICNAYRSVDIDFTVLLTHIGYENDLILAKLLKSELGVDLILGGHSHTLLEQPTQVNDILIAQVGVGTNQIGRFDIIVDTDENNIADFTREVIPIEDSHCPRDKNIEKILYNYKDQTDQKYNKILTKMQRDLTHPSRIVETEVGNLFADILKEQLGLDIMLLGTGSMRKDKMESIVTLAELKEMYPYGGEIYLLHMTGAELTQMIQDIFRIRFAENGEEFYARSKGISISYENKKVTKISFYHQDLDLEKTYTVGIQKFHFENALANLNLDPSQLKSEKAPKVICSNDFDLLEEYFMNNKDINAEIEGRIIFIE